MNLAVWDAVTVEHVVQLLQTISHAGAGEGVDLWTYYNELANEGRGRRNSLPTAGLLVNDAGGDIGTEETLHGC